MKTEAFTAKEIIKTLCETKGMVYLAAERLGCAPQTIYNYIERHPTVKAAWEAESGKVLDVGEVKLYEHVLKGEPWAVTFLLSTKGRNRGYVKREELGGDVADALREIGQGLSQLVGKRNASDS